MLWQSGLMGVHVRTRPASWHESTSPGHARTQHPPNPPAGCCCVLSAHCCVVRRQRPPNGLEQLRRAGLGPQRSAWTVNGGCMWSVLAADRSVRPTVRSGQRRVQRSALQLVCSGTCAANPSLDAPDVNPDGTSHTNHQSYRHINHTNHIPNYTSRPVVPDSLVCIHTTNYKTMSLASVRYPCVANRTT